MTYTIVHRMGRLVPWRFYLWHNKFALLVLIFRLFLRMGIRILNVKSKVMSYFKYPNGTAGGRFTGYAASWWHNSFNLHHFRPCFSSLIMTWNCPYFSTISALVISIKVFPCSLVASQFPKLSYSPKFAFSIIIAQLSPFLLIMSQIATTRLVSLFLKTN